MRVTAYTYDADVHCIACAVKRFGLTTAQAQSIPATVETDENGIPYAAEDSEGNKINPVFSTDENDFTHCGDCGGEL